MICPLSATPDFGQEFDAINRSDRTILASESVQSRDSVGAVASERGVVQIDENVVNGLATGGIHASSGKDFQVLAFADMRIQIVAGRDRGVWRNQVDELLDLLFTHARQVVSPERIKLRQRQEIIQAHGKDEPEAEHALQAIRWDLPGEWIHALTEALPAFLALSP